MRSTRTALVALWLVIGCEAKSPAAPSEPAVPSEVQPLQAAQPVQAVQPAPTSQPAPTDKAAATDSPTNTSERTFGAPLSAEGEPVAVAEILRDPKPFLGKSVKTSGVVARVCERAGCWLELKPEAGEGSGLRVPMANHAFMIPQDALGRPAVVEGELSAQALSPSHKQHLEGEGAQAVGPLALSARSVVVR